ENQPGGTLASPIYTGEVEDGVEFPTGQAIIPLRDVITSWLEKPLPNLLNRFNFPNLPDDVELGFIPIIFGVCQSLSNTNLEPQGVIKCWGCDTTLHRYVVASHLCHSVDTVYRKSPKTNALFKVVNPSEYQIVFDSPPRIINGVPYQMTFIQFNNPQPRGTIVHADVEGINYRYDLINGPQSLGVAT